MKAAATWSINGRFLSQPQTGVQRYAGEMTREIDTWLGQDDELARKLAIEICVPADCARVPDFANIAVRRSARGRGHGWEQLVLPSMARDGLISFANLGPLAHGRQILCLHDANVFLAPESYTRGFRIAYRAAFPLLARRARAVTTVSAFSAEMLKKAGVTGAKAARVIHNGHEHALRWDRTASRFDAPAHFKRPFVFALGSRAKHKQLDLLLGLAPALDALGLDLIVSGGTASIFAEAALTQTVNVFPVGFVSDDDLASLFAQAICFAFPSRTEGFGIPLVEAMVHGAPIVSSDAASMPEVCGDAALYASPDDPAAWLAQITRLAKDAGLRETLRAKGKARYPRFSWREGARAYLELALALSPQPAGESRGAAAPLVGRRAS
ncbi:Glycosyl transferase family 2 (fragment) [Beijerinckiaceae bacterium RH AL1]